MFIDLFVYTRNVLNILHLFYFTHALLTACTALCVTVGQRNGTWTVITSMSSFHVAPEKPLPASHRPVSDSLYNGDFSIQTLHFSSWNVHVLGAVHKRCQPRGRGEDLSKIHYYYWEKLTKQTRGGGCHIYNISHNRGYNRDHNRGHNRGYNRGYNKGDH